MRNSPIPILRLIPFWLVFICSLSHARNNNSGHTPPNSKEIQTAEYVYVEMNTYSTDIKHVKFVNGVSLTYVEQDPVKYGARKIRVTGAQGSNALDIAEDDHVYINAAYPSPENATVAVISHVCGGVICTQRKYFVVMPAGESFSKYEVGDSASKIHLFMSGDNLMEKSYAEGVFVGKDDYGSPVTVNPHFVNGVGFVNPKIKKYYAHLIGKNPYDYFEDKVAREFLVKNIGLDQFRHLREIMGVASNSTLLEGRYLIFNGCLPHLCPSAYGAVVIDTYTDDLWWTEVTDTSFNSGGTRKIEKKHTYL